MFIVAPGLTVKERLQVLLPGRAGNYLRRVQPVPVRALRQKLNQAEVLIENWHTLMPLKEPERSVVKKGAESDEAFTRRVLGKLAAHKDIVVINDEAHHAYRDARRVKISKKRLTTGHRSDEATRWIEGLDRHPQDAAHPALLRPLGDTVRADGKTNTEKALFDWIVSDFGLNDAIEAGLVKTPRVVVRDDALPDAKTLRPKLYHIYRDPRSREDLNRRRRAARAAAEAGAGRLYAARRRLARDAAAVAGSGAPLAAGDADGLQPHRDGGAHRALLQQGRRALARAARADRTLRVDSKVLEKAEIGETAGADKDYEARLQAIVEAADCPRPRRPQLLALKKEELLREIVDNVGKRGAAGPGPAERHLGGDAVRRLGRQERHPHHGLARVHQPAAVRAGDRPRPAAGRLRARTTNGLFLPEYVNVFGVPLSIFQEVGEGGEPPPPPKPSTQIESCRSATRSRFAGRTCCASRPSCGRRWRSTGPRWSRSSSIRPQTPITAELAPALGGATD